MGRILLLFSRLAQLLGVVLGVVVAAPGAVWAQEDDDEDALEQYMSPRWAKSLTEALTDTGVKYLKPADIRTADELSALGAKKNLKGLRLTSVALTDLSFLKKHPDLEVIELTNCGLTDISELAQLKKLRFAVLSYNQIQDLSPLAKLSQLQVLLLYRNLVSDLTPLAGLRQLRHLDLSDCLVADLSPLAGLSELTTLSLYKNKQIRDFAPLRGLTQLSDLNLSFCDPASISAEDLRPLSQLTNLRVQGGVISTMDHWRVLAEFRQLEYLTAGMNPAITSLEPLAGMTKLSYLDVHSCAVSDLKPLSGLVNLRKLVANYNRIGDLSPLAKCLRLHSLYCFANPLKEAAVLGRLPRLQFVILPKEGFGPEAQANVRQLVPKGCKLRFL